MTSSIGLECTVRWLNSIFFSQEEDLLTTFPTSRPPSLSSLFKQLQQFQRPAGGKKPAVPLPAALDMTEPGTPLTPGDEGTPVESDEERPRKRQRGSVEGDTGAARKKSGKTTGGKGTKPRTVVRGTRGLIPMETDADGNVHVGGRLPDSAMADGDGAEDEESEEAVPLAKRPELDEGERRRRELIKEKAKERENNVLRRLNQEVDGGEEADTTDSKDVDGDVELWEGVELVRMV